MSSQTSKIRFQFQDAGSAFSAYEMLDELGYQPEFRGTSHTDVEIPLDRSDLTSALEITQAYGGSLNDELMLTEPYSVE